MTKKPGGNLVRNSGPWNANLPPTFSTPESTPPGVPKKGWHLVNGKSSALSMVYYNGQPVSHISEFCLDIRAGEPPVLNLKIIMPNLSAETKS